MFNSLLKTYKAASFSRELDPKKWIKMASQEHSEVYKEELQRRNKVERSFWDWVASDKELKSVLQEHQVSPEDLSRLYHGLVEYGGANWVKQQLICVSAFVNPRTLDYLLRHKNDMDLSKVALRLTKYFEEEEEGAIAE